MVGQTRPYQSFLLFVSLTLSVGGCAPLSNPPLETVANEGRRATQFTQEREQALAALRAEMASTRIAAAKQEAELQALRTTVTQLRQENSESQQALSEARRTLEARQTELAALKAERDQVAQAHTQSDANERTLTTLQDRVASLSQELTQLRQTLTVVEQKSVEDATKRKNSLMADENKDGLVVPQPSPFSREEGQKSGRIVPALHVVREDAHPSTPSWITVQPGESWWSVARKYHTTMKALRAINRRLGDHLIVGEAIRLP